MRFAKKMKLPVNYWTLQTVVTHFDIAFDLKKLHTSDEDARVLSLVWFEMMALLDVEEPDIMLVEDLVAWVSNTEVDQTKRDKYRHQMHTHTLLDVCVEHALDLKLFSVTFTDDELEKKVSLKGDNQTCLMSEKKDDVKYSLLTVVGVYEATYVT